MGEVGGDPLVLLQSQYAVLPGQAIHCLLVALHTAYRLQVLVQYEYTAIGQSHCQQCLTLNGTKSQGQWDVVHPAAYHLSDGRFAASIQIHLSRNGRRSKVPKHRQTPRDLQHGRILTLSVAGVEGLAVLLFCLCGVEEDFAVGVAGREEVALVVILLVQDDSLVAVGVVEQRTHRRLLLRHYISTHMAHQNVPLLIGGHKTFHKDPYSLRKYGNMMWESGSHHGCGREFWANLQPIRYDSRNKGSGQEKIAEYFL